MSKYRHTDKKIKELEDEIKLLNKSLDYSHNMNQLLRESYNDADKKIAVYRKIIKYHTLLLVVMNLLCNTKENDDVTSIIKSNILEYYKKINLDMMNIPTNDDEEEGYDESESSDLWNGEEEFE